MSLEKYMKDIAESCGWRNVPASKLKYYSDAAACVIDKTRNHFHYANNAEHKHWSCTDKQQQEYEIGVGIGVHLSSAVARSIVFVGDSIMVQQFYSFICMLGVPIDVLNDSDKWTATRTAVWKNLTIRLKPSGLMGAWLSSVPFSATIEQELAALGPNDVVIANLGIHVNDLFSSEANATYFQLMNDVGDVVRRARADRGPDMPLLYWRESTPQNHPSTNGLWTQDCHMTCKCIILTDAMFMGGNSNSANHTACRPNCLPNNFRNIVANERLRWYDINIIRIYDELASAESNMHISGVDCTHMDINALAFMNQRLLHVLFHKWSKNISKLS
jgi:hypothetical protein